MIHAFNSMSTSMQMFLLLLHGLLVLFISWVFMRWLGERTRGRTDIVPVAPYFVAITTLYALFLAFHASNIWTRQQGAEKAFEEALTAIARLESLFGERGLGLEKARLHLSEYVDAVVRDEWPKGNTEASKRANQALADLRQELIQTSQQVPTALGNHLWRVFDDVVNARNRRLWIGKHGSNEQSWRLVLLLGLISHIAIGWVHADRQAAGQLATALFACATTIAYWHLAQASNPFAHLDTYEYSQAMHAK